MGAAMEAAYLVECYGPGLTAEAVEAAARRARGGSVRFLGALLVPADEVAFLQFLAASADEAAAAARAAGLAPDRVVAALRVGGVPA
jgi:hypothetical protein